MAIYGFGTVQGEKRNVIDDFINGNVAGTDYPPRRAPAVHNLLRRIQVGDIIYAKSYVRNTQELRVKAVGVVTDQWVKKREGVGHSVGVQWVWTNADKPERIPSDRDPTFAAKGHTLYEETHPKIMQRVVGLLLSQIRASAAGPR